MILFTSFCVFSLPLFFSSNLKHDNFASGILSRALQHFRFSFFIRHQKWLSFAAYDAQEEDEKNFISSCRDLMKISSVLLPCQFINCENKLNENEKGLSDWHIHTTGVIAVQITCLCLTSMKLMMSINNINCFYG